MYPGLELFNITDVNEYRPLPDFLEDIDRFAFELDYEQHIVDYNWADSMLKSNIFSYVKVGLIAYNIKRFRLYTQAKIKSFQEYCEKELGRKHWAINATIRAAKCVLKLIRAGFTILPQNEAQARPLTKFKMDEDMIDAWEKIAKKYQYQQHKLTATRIDEEINGMKEPQVKLSKNTLNKLALKAKELGMSPDDLLEEMLVDLDSGETEEPETEKIAEWESDLEELTKIEESGLTISFGKTLPQLLSGQKAVTRRCWKDSHAAKFQKAFDQNKALSVLDKDLRYGGKIIGKLLFTARPYKEELSNISPQDIELEGFPGMSKDEFISTFFEGNQNQAVWVIRFVFLSNNENKGVNCANI